ncbi:TonB family protein [Pseudobacteriovorax antillogorgiicola]|uniref:TonB family C-terminal domain-containing protein n=1 Tax=Pseudobacteriovorax antillogorgiicola TaxID=1513793 RepID=A0A1Y6CFH2_9BACT|nr:TonB family protein [Pseudobacteriovorax antillogorgiicola]TCS47282.1 TonB family protein [Pseudobacteriovorax antillogorgiicola]SMF62307.1 TonB family C-terminal domain-containing protein [Pseudobacteriovorax antillogorgiicola]
MNLEIRFTLPNQAPQTIPVRDRILIGTLMSNEVVIRAPGVEPIHAMIEVLEDGSEILTDLGSQTGVQLNGKDVEVEANLSIGDVIAIGDVKIDVLAFGASSNDNFQTATTQTHTKSFSLHDQGPDEGSESLSTTATDPGEPSMPPPKPSPDETQKVSRSSVDLGWDDNRSIVNKTIRTEPSPDRKKNILFSPRAAKPSGDVLEVVSYWGDTVLDVELFHPSFKGFDKCLIGTPPHAHLLAGGKSDVKSHHFVEVSLSGYKIRMMQDMQARIRKGGKVAEKKGSGSINLGRRDIAHVAHGPIKYFLMFVKPPSLQLPRSNQRDTVFGALVLAAALLYVLIIPAILFSDGVKDEGPEDDIWSIVNVPEKQETPKKEPPKPKQKIAEAPKPKTPPKPPKPKPQPPKPVPPKEVKPPPKVVKKPQPKPVAKPTKTLANKTPQPPTPKPNKVPGIGAKKPDKKLPGRINPKKKVGLAGGPRGGPKPNLRGGGQRRGKTDRDLKGAEGGAKDKASGVNLSKLGLGVGQVLNKTGAGAIKTNFANSAGGAGGGAGSGKKTYGLGGPGKGKTLAVSGTGGAANTFGSGTGGNGSGQGGLGGAGLTSGFNRGKGGAGRADVVVPATDPVIAGGLTQQEVQAVIRANLNQIRHCYEQLLQRSPSAQGKVKVRFVVQPNGRVGSAKITDSDISDMVMRGCVTGKVKRWKFPAPRGGQPVTVNYPFVFNPL